MVLYAYPQACPDRFSIRFAAAEPDDRTRTATCRARPAPAGWVRPPPERLRPRGSGSHPKAEGYFCEKAFNFITKVTFFSDFLIIFSSRPVPEYSRSAKCKQASRFSFLAYSYLGFAQDTPRSAKCKQASFCSRLIRIFGFAQDTLARQNASKLAFALAYSNSGLRRRYFVSA